MRAFLLAPLAAPAGYWLGLIGYSAFGLSRLSFDGAISALAVTFAIGTPIAYAVTLVPGAAVVFLLARFGWLRRPVLIVGAAILGAVCAWAMHPWLTGELFSIPFPPWYGALLGVLTGEVFWRLGADAR